MGARQRQVGGVDLAEGGVELGPGRAQGPADRSVAGGLAIDQHWTDTEWPVGMPAGLQRHRAPGADDPLRLDPGRRPIDGGVAQLHGPARQRRLQPQLRRSAQEAIELAESGAEPRSLAVGRDQPGLSRPRLSGRPVQHQAPGRSGSHPLQPRDSGRALEVQPAQQSDRAAAGGDQSLALEVGLADQHPTVLEAHQVEGEPGPRAAEHGQHARPAAALAGEVGVHRQLLRLARDDHRSGDGRQPIAIQPGPLRPRGPQEPPGSRAARDQPLGRAGAELRRFDHAREVVHPHRQLQPGPGVQAGHIRRALGRQGQVPRAQPHRHSVEPPRRPAPRQGDHGVGPNHPHDATRQARSIQRYATRDHPALAGPAAVGPQRAPVAAEEIEVDAARLARGSALGFQVDAEGPIGWQAEGAREGAAPGLQRLGARHQRLGGP